MLIGMSAPISQALIVYAELTQVHSSGHLQPTVIAVITGIENDFCHYFFFLFLSFTILPNYFQGVPVLAVLTTELARKSTGLHHESWWLMAGSGMFNIFIICATIMLLIFVLLHIGIIHKAQALIAENVLKKETIGIR